MIDSAEYVGGSNGMIKAVIGGKDHYIPNSEGNSDRAILAEWESQGGVVAIHTQDLEKLRSEKVSAIKNEGLKRIQSKVDAIDSIAMAKLIYKHMWPQSNPSAELLAGEVVYNYAASKIAQANSATRDQLEAYNPVTDPSWPL